MNEGPAGGQVTTPTARHDCGPEHSGSRLFAREAAGPPVWEMSDLGLLFGRRGQCIKLVDVHRSATEKGWWKCENIESLCLMIFQM
jgi:hypothetical protein